MSKNLSSKAKGHKKGDVVASDSKNKPQAKSNDLEVDEFLKGIEEEKPLSTSKLMTLAKEAEKKLKEAFPVFTRRYGVLGDTVYLEMIEILSTLVPYRPDQVDIIKETVYSKLLSPVYIKPSLNKWDFGKEDLIVSWDQKEHNVTYEVKWVVVEDEKRLKDLALGILHRLFNDPDFVKSSLKSKSLNLSDEDKLIIEKAGVTYVFDGFETYINSMISEQLKTAQIKSPIGVFNKKEADEFAAKMSPHLDSVREASITSTRAIADYFNKKKVLSALGGKWTASSVSALIKRRQVLGIESKNEIAKLKKKSKKITNTKDEKVFLKKMGKHLIQVRSEGFNSTRKIASRFNELGICTKTGATWSNVTVHKLIKRRQELGLE